MRTMTKKSIFVAVSLAAMAAAQPAWADDAPAAGPAAANGAPASDIVVTAQRRKENVQNISIAITALSAGALEEKKVLRQLDLQNASPGLTITKAGLTESVNIRGIGLSSGSPQVTNGVSTYYDGIFQPPIVSSSQFYDMDSIEVLRGPQGTLVGANSTGGAIYMNSKKPELNKLGGEVTLWGGSYTNLGANAAVNVPLGSNLALRLAGVDNTRDSYYTDLGTAHTTPDRLSEHDGRAQLLWKTGGFQALAKVEAINKQTGGYAYQPIAVAPLQYAAGATGQPWTVSYDSPESNYERATLTSLEMKYITQGGLTFRSLTGYLNKRINNLYDSDGTDLPISAATPQATQNQFVREREYSEEINLISPDTGNFKYVLGAYGQRNKINVRIDSGTLKAVGGAVGHTYIQPDTDKALVGLFGQATYRLSDQFWVEAGARYSHFHVDGTGGVYAGVPAPVCTGVLHNDYVAGLGCDVAPQTGSEGDGRATGKIALNYKPNSDNLLYAFVARGYKNGGINPPGGSFAPETVWDYEAGWKSSFLDRHIKTQMGIYYNNYSNFQEDVVNPASGQSGVTNLTSATIYGFEASAQAHLGAFSVDGALAYNHSSMSAFSAINRALVPAGISTPQCSPAGTTGTSGAGCYNYPYFTTTGGSSNLLSPTWTWNINAAYKLAMGNGDSITPRVGYSYVGSQWDYVTYNPTIDRIGAHGLVNASITYAHDNLKVEAYGTNLGNTWYAAGRSGNNLLYGAPREYGLRLSASF